MKLKLSLLSQLLFSGIGLTHRCGLKSLLNYLWHRTTLLMYEVTDCDALRRVGTGSINSSIRQLRCPSGSTSNYHGHMGGLIMGPKAAANMRRCGVELCWEKHMWGSFRWCMDVGRHVGCDMRSSFKRSKGGEPRAWR